jgi:hypothetical protein
MKAARPFPLYPMLLLAAFVLFAVSVSAGSSENPEITDAAEDPTTGRTAHDIVRGWATDDNSTITVVIEVTGLDAFSPMDDWRTLPTSVYEYYFTVEEKNYAARATIPVHGLLAAFASFSLFEVKYGSGEGLNYTSVDDSITGRYSVNTNTIEVDVDKSAVGTPSPGDVMSHMWARTFFQPRGGDREEVDTAMSFSAPGRNYTITGASSQYYSIHLRAQNVTVIGKPREVVTFNISIVSTSTTDVEVNLTNRALPAGYYINFSRLMPIPVPQGSTVAILVLISIPGNASNTTDLPFTLFGSFETEEGEVRYIDDLNLMVKVRFIPVRPPEENLNALQWFWKRIIVPYQWYIVAAIVAVVAVSVLYYFGLNRQKREDEDIIAYQAYLDSMRQQREMGGM